VAELSVWPRSWSLSPRPMRSLRLSFGVEAGLRRCIGLQLIIAGDGRLVECVEQRPHVDDGSSRSVRKKRLNFVGVLVNKPTGNARRRIALGPLLPFRTGDPAPSRPSRPIGPGKPGGPLFSTRSLSVTKASSLNLACVSASFASSARSRTAICLRAPTRGRWHATSSR